MNHYYLVIYNLSQENFGILSVDTVFRIDLCDETLLQINDIIDSHFMFMIDET
jgi:hypothetical protein